MWISNDVKKLCFILWSEHGIVGAGAVGCQWQNWHRKHRRSRRHEVNANEKCWWSNSALVNVDKVCGTMLARIDSYKISTVYRPDAKLISLSFASVFLTLMCCSTSSTDFYHFCFTLSVSRRPSMKWRYQPELSTINYRRHQRGLRRESQGNAKTAMTVTVVIVIEIMDQPLLNTWVSKKRMFCVKRRNDFRFHFHWRNRHVRCSSNTWWTAPFMASDISSKAVVIGSKGTTHNNALAHAHLNAILIRRDSSFRRIWWILAFFFCVALCCWSILEVYKKSGTDPIIISIDSKLKPVTEIAFPAVTICPEAKYRGDSGFNLTTVNRLYKRDARHPHGFMSDDNTQLSICYLLLSLDDCVCVIERNIFCPLQTTHSEGIDTRLSSQEFRFEK